MAAHARAAEFVRVRHTVRPGAGAELRPCPLPALTMTSASSFQMLRGSVIIFTGLFSVAFLGRRLAPSQWLGILATITGLVIVGLADLRSKHDDQHKLSDVITGAGAPQGPGLLSPPARPQRESPAQSGAGGRAHTRLTLAGAQPGAGDREERLETHRAGEGVRLGGAQQ